MITLDDAIVRLCMTEPTELNVYLTKYLQELRAAREKLAAYEELHGKWVDTVAEITIPKPPARNSCNGIYY